MPKGIPVPAEQRANAITQAIPALRDGVPTNTIAKAYGIAGRTLYTWLQRDPQAFQARLEAIHTGRRFAHARAVNLTRKQLEFRQQQALRRLSFNPLNRSQ